MVCSITFGLVVWAAAATPASPPTKFLMVWAGDWNASDHSSGDAASVATAPAAYASEQAASDPVGPDFLAVIDATPGSGTYGHVLRTIPVPGVENEPHHMQYTWHPGERIYAGGLFSARTFVFNVDDPLNTALAGVVEPTQTPCGSVPDAYWVLRDKTAMGTYMGGPLAAGDPRCNGGVNNGFAGTPGEVVRIAPDATVIGEYPAAGPSNRPFAADSRTSCGSNPPLLRRSCANPHGIQAREDLGLMITSDYAEPRNVPIDPAHAPDSSVFRDTVRVWDIGDLAHPRVRSVSVMPAGSMAFSPPPNPDAKGVMGIMETTVTNRPEHKGAFASSMCGGQVYYSADVTIENPMWRQVFDASTAAIHLDQARESRLNGCIGAGWLQTSPDDTLLFQAVIGRNPGTLGPADPGVPKMVYAIDIRKLLNVAPDQWTVDNTAVCTIDTKDELLHGGNAGVDADNGNCPDIVGTVDLGPASPVADSSSGGPHWGAIDNQTLSGAAGRISDVTRIVASNYFVARAGIDGNHAICMIAVAANGSLSLDTSFQDENTHRPCVSFNRMQWPNNSSQVGPSGWAKPHSMLFVGSP